MLRLRNLLAAAALSLALAGSWFIAPQNVRVALAQGVTGVFQNGLPTAPSVYGIGDPSSGFYFGTGYVAPTKHVRAGSVATANLPVLSSCGTSAALATGSTDFAGQITVGTTASNACTMTFGTAYSAAPFCVVQNKTTGAAANVYTISTTAIVWSSALADSTVLYYICVGPGA